MPPREKRSTVKGTTRVSYNDRQLVRKLFSANKNSRQARQKQSRELSKEDKARLSQAPHRRSQDAFANWLKKSLQGDFLFDFRDTDDKIAVKAMCLTQWSDLIERRERMQDLSQTFRKAKQATTGAIATLLGKMSTLLSVDCETDVPLLTGRKHQRANNYRKKALRRSNLFATVPRQKRQRNSDTPSDAKRNLDMFPDAKKRRKSSARDAQLYAVQSTRNLCEPLPKCDYEDCDSNVFYVCHRCNEPVQATKMIVKPSGAFDALFFHSTCAY